MFDYKEHYMNVFSREIKREGAIKRARVTSGIHRQ
jgi:hypothetical protein